MNKINEESFNNKQIPHPIDYNAEVSKWLYKFFEKNLKNIKFDII